MDAERAALLTLIRSAGGRATIEPTTMLALAVLSPWSGDRPGGFYNRPSRIAPTFDAGALLAFLDEVAPLLSDRRLPLDSGFLAWTKYHSLAVPVSSLTRVPAWLEDPALTDAWICRPPAAGYPPVAPDDTMIQIDGRVAALHMLIVQAAGGMPDPGALPHDAIRTVYEWFAGPYAAQPSSAASDQCALMRFTWQHPGNQAWANTIGTANVVPVDMGLKVITRATPIVPDSWRVPPPTPAEVAAEQERQRILAEGQIALKAWQNRARGHVRSG